MQSGSAKGVLAMFIAVAAFSFMDALLKLFAAHYPPMQVIFLRATASLPFLLLPLWWRGGLAELRPTRPWLHLARALLGIVMLSTFVIALRDAPLASVYSVYMFAPLLIAAFAAWFLRERVDAGCWIAIVVGFLGVLVILQPRPDGLPAAAGLAALVSALCYAAAVLVARVLTRTEISEHVYARDLDPDSNTLDVLIGRIRRKLGQPQLLVTERGQGFRLHSAPPADDRP